MKKLSLGDIYVKDVSTFSEPAGRQIISLLVLITLEQVNTSVVGKKKESLLSEQNFDGEANWSGTI